MRGRRDVFVLASLALLGCRAVLGIEEIEETTDARELGACAEKAGTECGKCCRDRDPTASEELETKLAPCKCDGICRGGAEAEDAACVSCVLTTVKSGDCPKERDACLESPACKAVHDCLAACK